VVTPRTANYVAALIREGDNFDYCKWLQQVRAEETPARELRKAKTEQIVSEEIGAAVGTCRGRETSPNVRPFNRRVPIPIGITHSRRKALHSSSGTRIRWRFQKIRDAWDKFQANRARDAVYGYLEAVFAIVKRLLRHAFECAELPFDKNADPFTAVIRYTSDDNADNKTISKWARALRYVARCKEPRKPATAFIKEAGGVNACADRYAEYLGRGAR
jgi:hypothetical protein